LIFRKIIKIVATRCHLLRLKCTKFDFGWGSAPDSTGELIALPRPLTGFEAVLHLRERKRMREWKGKEAGRGSKGRKGEGREWGKEGCVMAFREMDAP